MKKTVTIVARSFKKNIWSSKTSHLSAKKRKKESIQGSPASKIAAKGVNFSTNQRTQVNSIVTNASIKKKRILSKLKETDRESLVLIAKNVKK